MKYQLAGIQFSVLIHAAAFLLVFGVSRMMSVQSVPITIELGMLSGSAGAERSDVREKSEPRKMKKQFAKPIVKQQVAPSETAVAEKPVVKQEQASVQEASDVSQKASDSGSNNNAAEVVGPVFDVDYLHNPKPQYPLVARRMKLEGTVIVHVLVGSTGKPEVVSLGKSSGAAVLDQAALNAVQNWSFLPARQGNKTVPAWVDVPIHFHLI
jgi:protein TonB